MKLRNGFPAFWLVFILFQFDSSLLLAQRKASISIVSWGIEIRQTDGTEDLEISNDTSLYLNVELRPTGDETSKPYHSYVNPISKPKELIPPQGGLGEGFVASLRKFSQPKGRNCLINVVTSGCAKSVGKITETERKLNRQLLARSVAENIATPIIAFFLDLSEEESKAIHGTVMATLLHEDSQLLAQIQIAGETGQRGRIVKLTFETIMADFI